MDGCAGQQQQGLLCLFRPLVILLMLALPLAVVSAGTSADPPLSLPQGSSVGQSGPVKSRPSPVAYFFYIMGYHHELNQRFSEALTAYRLAYEYDPDSAAPVTSLVAVMSRSGDVRGAIDLAEQAIQKHPQSVELRMLLGNLYSSLRERQAAMAQFQEVLELDPTFEEAYISLGALHEEERNYTAARTLLELLLVRQPKSFLGYFHLARIMVELKDYASAEAMLQ